MIWRTVMPGLPRICPGTGGSTAGAVPTLPERSRTATTTMYVPGGAGAPSTWPSQTPRRLPVRPLKRATSRGGSTSVRSTRKRGGRRRPTPRARISKPPGVGPAIGGSTDSTTGVGAVVSTLNEPATTTVRPVRRRPSCMR